MLCRLRTVIHLIGRVRLVRTVFTKFDLCSFSISALEDLHAATGTETMSTNTEPMASRDTSTDLLQHLSDGSDFMVSRPHPEHTYAKLRNNGPRGPKPRGRRGKKRKDVEGDDKESGVSLE
jgi:hypothetical protein